MKLAELRRAGHWPTLLAAFLYFDVSFAVWYVLGPLAPFIADDLGLTIAEKGVLVATPLLGGSICRIALGFLTDHVGPRRAGLFGIALTFVPLLLGWLVADSYRSLLGVALLLGVPGASFAVALPLASRWYPPRHQGLVMGIAGAGNSGTVLASLFMPRLAAAFGWHAAIGLALVPMALVTGLVGAAGGLGGFFLPSMLGVLRDATGAWTLGFAVLAAICLWGMTLMVAVKGAWHLTWANPLAGATRASAIEAR